MKAEETTVVGPVRRVEQDSVVLMTEGMKAEGRRAVGRPAWTWRKCTERDVNWLGPREETAQDMRVEKH